MFLKNKLIRNTISILLVALFGFSAIFSIFNNKNSVIKIGSEKITVKDIIDIGGKNEESYNTALRTLIYCAQINNEAKSLGLTVSDQDIQNRIKSTFSKNGQFSKEVLEKYLKESNVSQAGLIKLIRSGLLEQQLFALINLGVKVSDKSTNRFLSGLNRVQSGYVLDINSSDLSDKLILQYADPKDSDLFDYLLDGGEYLANKECYVFYINTDEYADLSLEDLKERFPYEKSFINNNKIFLKSSRTSIRFDKDDLDRSTCLTNPIEIEAIENDATGTTDGSKCVVYYNPMYKVNLDDARLAWPSESVAKAKALKEIAKSIITGIQQCKSDADKENLIQNYLLDGKKFRFVKNVSFKEYFQNRGVPNNYLGNEKSKLQFIKSSSNDCMCSSCFIKDNPEKIIRPAAIMLLLGDLFKAQHYQNDFKLIITLPTYRTTRESSIDAKLIKEFLTSQMKQKCIEAVHQDIMHSTYSII